MDPELQRIIEKGIAAGLSDDDIRGLALEHASRTTPPAAATAGMLPQETPQDAPPPSAVDKLDAMAGMTDQWKNARAAGADAMAHPIRAAVTAAAPLAIPGVLSLGAEYGGPAIRAIASGAAKALGHPAVGGAVGATEGYRRGGVEGAVVGGALGASGSTKVGNLLKRLGLDTAPAATPAAAPKASTLAKELLMREPDWRTVDAVPINAMKAKGILEPGESRVGLAERAAVAQKAKDAAEVDRLLKALRQRMNISAAAGR